VDQPKKRAVLFYRLAILRWCGLWATSPPIYRSHNHRKPVRQALGPHGPNLRRPGLFG